MRTEAPLLAPIFRADGQARLLSTLLLTGDELSLTSLAQRAGLAYPNVHREVARLVDAGILSERQVGRTRLIRADDESPLAGPLREILTVTTGPIVMMAEELGHIDGVESAFVYAPLPRGCSGMPVRRPTTSTSWCSVRLTWTRSTRHAPESRPRCAVP